MIRTQNTRNNNHTKFIYIRYHIIYYKMHLRIPLSEPTNQFGPVVGHVRSRISRGYHWCIKLVTDPIAQISRTI